MPETVATSSPASNRPGVPVDGVNMVDQMGGAPAPKFSTQGVNIGVLLRETLPYRLTKLRPVDLPWSCHFLEGWD